MLRTTLTSMLSRKLRLVLSGLAVVLGVMFVSGAFVLTDTIGRSFERMFADVFTYTDVAVNKPGQPGLTGQPVAGLIPAEQVDRVAKVDGVARATGQIFAEGARVVDKNNKVVLSTGGPRFGGGWVADSRLIELRSGRPPTADTEIAISANLARTTGYALGDQVGVITPFSPKKQLFTLVGVVGYIGGRDSLGGETSVLFTEPVAQRLMLGEPNVYNTIEVTVAPGERKEQVRDRIAAQLGDEYQVITGEQLAQDNADGLKQALSFFSYLLLGFAAIALFVGSFLILNTFSIIVAQRTRELALLRAIGAGRRQVIGSVLTEAVVIGALSSLLGLGLGIGVGALGGYAMGNFFTGGSLAFAGLTVPLSSVIAAFSVGIGITVLAALLPAVRASRIPPVAAMRDISTPDRPLTTLTVAGAAVLVVGAALLGLGLAGRLGGSDLWGVLAGLLISFIGVALLTPVVSRPIVSLLGKLLSWSSAGDLGRRNSARNPRRTAITAAALMVSIALVTGISVIFSSIRASTVAAVDAGINAELVIASDGFGGGGLPTMDPQTLAEIRQLPGVQEAVGFYVDLIHVDGSDEFVGALDDMPAALRMFEIEPVSGVLAPLAPGHVLLDDRSAADRGLTTGSKVAVSMARGGERTMVVQGVYRRTAVNSGFFLALADAQAGFAVPAPTQGFVTLKPGADAGEVRAQVDKLLADSPEVSVARLDEFIQQQASILDAVLIFVQVLLGLAMLIAVLGIINTLALSMTERTRELGLLRAVGMKQRQVMWMVTVESVVISVFGALLGIVVGVGLGTSVFQALRDQGFTELAFPWPLMGIYVGASVVVGLMAGLLPAVRAARLDVLRAIAYE